MVCKIQINKETRNTGLGLACQKGGGGGGGGVGVGVGVGWGWGEDSEESGSLIGGTIFHPLTTLCGFTKNWYPPIAMNISSDQRTGNIVHHEILNN